MRWSTVEFRDLPISEEVEPMRECEGILVTADDDRIEVSELRLNG